MNPSFPVLFSVLLFAMSSMAADGYLVTAGSSMMITEHSTCRSVTNSGSKTRFVPTKSSAEWTSFISNPPAAVSVGACCTGGGVAVGGYCWSLGAANQSCDTVCATKGGCNLTGIRDYAGSGGNATNCTAVLTALFGAITAADVGASPHGCVITFGSIGMRFTATTTCAAAAADTQRACACNN